MTGFALGERVPVAEQIAGMPRCGRKHRVGIGGMTGEAGFSACAAGKITPVASGALCVLPGFHLQVLPM